MKQGLSWLSAATAFHLRNSMRGIQEYFRGSNSSRSKIDWRVNV